VSDIIYLAPINQVKLPLLDRLSVDLQKCISYQFKVLKLSFNLKFAFSKERNQYNSTLLLATVLKSLPEGGGKIIGLTDVDIFIPILTFLFGEAQLNGSGAIVSIFRLRNEYYGLPRDDELLYRRTLKEISHELGHTLGLVHCPNFECVMNSSTYVENIDLKKNGFCKNCQQILGIQCPEEKTD
jgi:archaemetzincin